MVQERRRLVKGKIVEVFTHAENEDCPKRVFHSYINGKHCPEFCGCNYVEVKKLMAFAGVKKFKFVRGLWDSPLPCL